MLVAVVIAVWLATVAALVAALMFGRAERRLVGREAILELADTFMELTTRAKDALDAAVGDPAQTPSSVAASHALRGDAAVIALQLRGLVGDESDVARAAHLLIARLVSYANAVAQAPEAGSEHTLAQPAIDVQLARAAFAQAAWEVIDGDQVPAAAPTAGRRRHRLFPRRLQHRGHG